MTRLKLNIFSPLPPERTEIARNLADLLPALSQHADVTLWTEQKEWDRGLEAHARVTPRHWLNWPAVNEADATLYQIGNNVNFHAWIWDMALVHPGIMVLHDTVLQQFFSDVYLGRWRSPRAYREVMTALHGREGGLAARRLLFGETDASLIAEDFPLTELAIIPARGAIVHSDAGFDALKAFDRVPVARLDLAIPPGPAPRARDDAPASPVRLVVFGHLGPNRRLTQIVDALATLPAEERVHYRLDIYGRNERETVLRDRVREHGLDGTVALHGFVDEAVLDAALAGADLALNLRMPSMGEASASQLRIWSHALPSLVTRIGWYAELPEDVVGFVAPEREADDILAHLRAFRAEPARYRAMGRAGRARLEARHTPDAYARNLLAALGPMLARPPASLPHLIGPALAAALPEAVPSALRKAQAARTSAEIARWMRAVPATGKLSG